MKTKIAIGSKLCKMAFGGGHGHGRRRSGRRRPCAVAVRRARAWGWRRGCHARPRVGWGVAPVVGGVKMVAAAAPWPFRPGRTLGEAEERRARFSGWWRTWVSLLRRVLTAGKGRRRAAGEGGDAMAARGQQPCGAAKGQAPAGAIARGWGRAKPPPGLSRRLGSAKAPSGLARRRRNPSPRRGYRGVGVRQAPAGAIAAPAGASGQAPRRGYRSPHRSERPSPPPG
jgi:hypothetical protein